MRPMISVVVPVHNEQDNIEPLLKEISQNAALSGIGEIIYVDDGSVDGTPEVLASMRRSHPSLRIVRHKNRSGQSAALWTGVKAAKHEIVVTLDGDGQNDPADIKKLYDMFKSHGGDKVPVMVAGQREKRHDDFIRRVSSRIANIIRAALLRDKTRDTGCSLKMFRRSDFLALPYFNHMHRFLPALMMREGVEVLHVGVSHRPRDKGRSKYGTLDRLAASLLDIFGVMWLIKRARPETGASEER